MVSLDLFSEVYAVEPNPFLPIRTKILIQLNPVILTLGISHSPLFRTNIHFTWFFSFFPVVSLRLIRTRLFRIPRLFDLIFCQRIRERQMRKKREERGYKLRIT